MNNNSFLHTVKIHHLSLFGNFQTKSLIIQMFNGQLINQYSSFKSSGPDGIFVAHVQKNLNNIILHFLVQIFKAYKWSLNHNPNKMVRWVPEFHNHVLFGSFFSPEHRYKILKIVAFSKFPQIDYEFSDFPEFDFVLTSGSYTGQSNEHFLNIHLLWPVIIWIKIKI